ncbi:MAG: hypothetical protein AB2A00_10105 [Myxococcota bacterium]
MRATRLAQSAVLLLALAGCAAGEATSQAPSGEWTLDLQQRDGILLSVWGTGSTDVWAAGGQAGRGLVLHGDGVTWREVPTGADSLLWWIYGFGVDDVYAVGENGLILHYDGTRWERAHSGTTRTLFGVWGASGDDVWMVGGDPSGEPGAAVILRGQGRFFQPVADIPPELVPDAFFKVYGNGRHDVIVVGRSGTVLRWDGVTWRKEGAPTRRPIISLWGRGANDMYAVGGQDSGEVLHYDGAEWRQVSGIGPSPGLNGVFTGPGRPVFAVGADAFILEISPEGEASVKEAPATDKPLVLHSVWGDEKGTVYAVGGDLHTYPRPMSGVILRRR